ncbi:MAG: PAS domain S-box protein, partial [bacterium]
TIHDGLLSDLIRSIYQAADGTVWCGADSLGISSYRDERWVRYTRMDGLKGRVVRAIGEYPKGTIWIALQNAGIACYRPTEEGPNTLIQEAPQTIAPGEHGVFAFSGSDTWNLTSHEDLVFSWRILSRSKRSILIPWTQFSRDTVVVTPRLDPGLYTFQVRAADKDRNIDRTADEMNFRVLLPVWKTSEFLVTVSILSGIILIAVILLYQKHLSLRTSEKKYRQLIESINDIIYTLDEDGVITYVSPAIRSVLGYRPSDLIGRSGFDLVHPDDRSRSMESFQRILAGESQVSEYHFVAASGDLRWMRTSTRMVSRGNRVIGVHGIVTDMTDRKQAEDALQQAHDDLEHRVKERTNDLLEANRALKDEIAERKRAEKHIHILTQELIKAQENERRKIALDLHDNVAQELSGVRVGLSMLFDDHPEISHEVKQKVSDLSKILHESIVAIRDLAYYLRPSSLDQLGLVNTVFQYGKDFSEKTNTQFEFYSAGLDNLELDFDTAINLYRVTQEALNNVKKHAAASHVTIRLAASSTNILLRIEDNGKGFDVQERTKSALLEKRMGLGSMEERISLLQGRMNIASHPNEGTKVLIEVPFKERVYDSEETHTHR